MPRRRLDESFSLLLILPFVLATALTARGDDARLDLDSDDLNPHELNVNVDEPKIDIPEVEHKHNPFRNVSQGKRSPSQDPLVKLCQEAVDTTTRRLLSTDQHTPWQMLHALLGLRHDFMLQHDGQVVNGLEWIAQGQVFDNEYWFEKTQFGGRAHPYTRPYAFEGHANQTVAVLSMCGVDLDMEFGTVDGTITMRQMVEHAKASLDVKKDEPTWSLWALSRYLPPDARWRTAKGEMWSIEKLVQEQTARPLKGAACGGTHGLFALAHARNVYQRKGKPLRGVWQQAEFKIRKYIQTARMQQNSNGTLSSNYFRGRQYNPDFNKRMASVGHVLEFLMISVTQEELNSLWIRRAVEATARDLLNNRKAYVKCSPLYHSVNALNIYLDRVNPRSAPEIATAEEPARTAMATPNRLQDSRGGLKGVPAIGISESRDLNAPASPDESTTDEAEAVDKEAPAEAETTEDNQTAEPASVPILLPTPDVAESTPDTEVEVVPVEDPEPKPIVKENGIWKPTPEARRRPIILPTERASDEMQVTPTVPDSDSDHPLSTSAPREESAAATETSDAEPTRNDPVADTITSTSDAAESSTEEAVAEQSTRVFLPMRSVSAPREVASTTDSNTVADASLTSDVNAQSPGGELNELVSAADAVASAVDLQAGQRVAIMGTETSLFLKTFSTAVAGAGHVFAIDSVPSYVELLEAQTQQQELTNVDVVRNDEKSLMLGQHRVKTAFLCNAYQQFTYRPQMLASIFRTLEYDGELILVELPNAEDSDKSQIRSEVEAAGFRYVEEVAVSGLKKHCFLRFRRPAL